MKTFRVTYYTKGLRIIDVTTKHPLPDNWDSLKTEEQDEWLYQHQEYSVLHAEDTDFGKADSIIELRQSLRTIS